MLIIFHRFNDLKVSLKLDIYVKSDSSVQSLSPTDCDKKTFKQTLNYKKKVVQKVMQELIHYLFYQIYCTFVQLFLSYDYYSYF